jgi:hypothetical protein
MHAKRWVFPLLGGLGLAAALTGCGPSATGASGTGGTGGPAALGQPAWCGPANSAFTDQDAFGKVVVANKKVTPEMVAQAKKDDVAFLTSAPADAKADVTILTTQFDKQADGMLASGELPELPQSYLDAVTRFRSFSSAHGCHLTYSDDNG